MIKLIEEAISKKIRHLYINNGEEFKPWIETQNEIWTQQPSILLRCSIDLGKPRYVSYLTFHSSIEQVCYMDGGLDSRTLLSRFMEGVYLSELPAYTIRTNNFVTELNSFEVGQ